jgi:Tfp pilus assembly protein PilF
MRARILSLAARHEHALAECQAMLKDTIKPSDMIDIRYIMSHIYSQAKQMAKAEEELQWILQIDPLHAGANNDLGYYWAEQGKNLPQAEAMIRKAIEMDRSFRPAEDHQDKAAYVDSLGWVLFRKGDTEGARKELERAATLPDGEDPVIWDHLGDVYHRLAMLPRAHSSWTRAKQLYEREGRDKDDRYREVLRKLENVAREMAGK